LSEQPVLTGTSGTPPAAHRSKLDRVVTLTRAVVHAEPAQIEAAAQAVGRSRRWLAPVAWAAGALVLAFDGIRLLLTNWRLSLVELVPAAWVWVVTWELKQHTLRGATFRQVTIGGVALLCLLCIVATIASFWCNTIFAFSIDNRPPRVGPAARKARRHLRQLLAAAAVVVPRIGPEWLYAVTLGGVLGVLLISFVAIPARIIGVQRRKLPPKQAVGRMAAGGALSAVAVAPGFLLNRLGLIMLGVSGLHLIGIFVLSVGVALDAAGLSSVRAVKLAMKLTPGQDT
jgi:hypothetical protein